MKKNPFHNLLINIILMLAVITVLGAIFELLVRILPISDNIGWSRAPLLGQRVKKFNVSAPIKIVALGDSFLAWCAGEGKNMFDFVQKNLNKKGYAILNLGSPGGEIDNYIEIYEKYVRFKPEGIIVCVYLGNDVVDYSLALQGKCPPTTIFDKEGKGWKASIKRNCILANLIFRFCKKELHLFRSGTLDRNIQAIKKWGNLTDAVIQERLKQIDPHTLELARSESVNPWVLAAGITLPDYYKDLFSLSSSNARIKADTTVKILYEFYKKQGIKNFFVVLLSESIQISEEYDQFYKKCGFDLENFPLEERRNINRYLKEEFNKLGIKTLDVTDALEGKTDIYIDFDTHFNAKGQRIVGDSITDFLEANFLAD